MNDDDEVVLLRGTFDPKLKTYLLLQWVVVFVVTIFGVVLLVLLPAIVYLIDRQYRALSCEMTEKFLKVRKGVLVRVEKNVPLEQITDLGIVEGPVMRYLGIKQLSVETAGQSAQGPLVKLLAVEDTEAFRDRVLAQRDRLRKTIQSDTPPAALADNESIELQREILATLRRIEGALKQT